MLFTIRVIFATMYCIIICLFGSIYCLFDLNNVKNVALFSHMFGRLAPLFGLKIEIRKPKDAENFGNAIYISNHQNNYDMITLSNIVQPKTIIVGKKSLLWIPFFGQLYWLTGNIMINRNNRMEARKTFSKIINYFNKKNVSILIFPEGTRSRGKGLLAFKTGAFYTAIMAGVPIVPICVSNTSNKINLNRLNNGLVIIEMLSPIDVSHYKKNQVRELTNYCHKVMMDKINALDKEIKERET